MAVTGQHYCVPCGRRFNRQFTWRRHMDTVHNPQDTYTCTEKDCNRRFKRRDVLERHKSNQHGISKVECPNCGKHIRKDGLQQHQQGAVCRAHFSYRYDPSLSLNRPRPDSDIWQAWEGSRMPNSGHPSNAIGACATGILSLQDIWQPLRTLKSPSNSSVLSSGTSSDSSLESCQTHVKPPRLSPDPKERKEISTARLEVWPGPDLLPNNLNLLFQIAQMDPSISQEAKQPQNGFISPEKIRAHFTATQGFADWLLDCTHPLENVYRQSVSNGPAFTAVNPLASNSKQSREDFDCDVSRTKPIFDGVGMPRNDTFEGVGGFGALSSVPPVDPNLNRQLAGPSCQDNYREMYRFGAPPPALIGGIHVNEAPAQVLSVSHGTVDESCNTWTMNDDEATFWPDWPSDDPTLTKTTLRSYGCEEQEMSGRWIDSDSEHARRLLFVFDGLDEGNTLPLNFSSLEEPQPQFHVLATSKHDSPGPLATSTLATGWTCTPRSTNTLPTYSGYSDEDRSAPGARPSSSHAHSEYMCTHPQFVRPYASRSALNKHARKHLRSNVRPYECDVCPNRFLYKKDLARHSSNHLSTRYLDPTQHGRAEAVDQSLTPNDPGLDPDCMSYSTIYGPDDKDSFVPGSPPLQRFEPQLGPEISPELPPTRKQRPGKKSGERHSGSVSLVRAFAPNNPNLSQLDLAGYDASSESDFNDSMIEIAEKPEEPGVGDVERANGDATGFPKFEPLRLWIFARGNASAIANAALANQTSWLAREWATADLPNPTSGLCHDGEGYRRDANESTGVNFVQNRSVESTGHMPPTLDSGIGFSCPLTKDTRVNTVLLVVTWVTVIVTPIWELTERTRSIDGMLNSDSEIEKLKGTLLDVKNFLKYQDNGDHDTVRHTQLESQLCRTASKVMARSPHFALVQNSRSYSDFRDEAAYGNRLVLAIVSAREPLRRRVEDDCMGLIRSMGTSAPVGDSSTLVELLTKGQLRMPKVSDKIVKSVILHGGLGQGTYLVESLQKWSVSAEPPSLDAFSMAQHRMSDQSWTHCIHNPENLSTGAGLFRTSTWTIGLFSKWPALWSALFPASAEANGSLFGKEPTLRTEARLSSRLKGDNRVRRSYPTTVPIRLRFVGSPQRLMVHSWNPRVAVHISVPVSETHISSHLGRSSLGQALAS